MMTEEERQRKIEERRDPNSLFLMKCEVCGLKTYGRDLAFLTDHRSGPVKWLCTQTDLLVRGGGIWLSRDFKKGDVRIRLGDDLSQFPLRVRRRVQL